MAYIIIFPPRKELLGDISRFIGFFPIWKTDIKGYYIVDIYLELWIVEIALLIILFFIVNKVVVNNINS